MFDATLDYALATLPQSIDEDLLGFEIDADAALGEEDLLLEGAVTRTEDPRQRIVLTAILSDNTSALVQAEDAVWRIWRVLAFSDFQATRLVRGSDALELSFITAARGLCVTGVLRVGGPHYQKLFRKGR